MRNKRSQSDLDFVRRAGKEIVCCLLPDELPYFDAIWQAIEPMLKDPAFYSVGHTEYLDLLRDRLGSLAFASKWSRDADLLTAPVMRLLDNTLRDSIIAGVCSEDRIAELVARHSLRWPAPDRFLRMVHMFVAEFCGGVVQPDKETEELLQHARSLVHHSICYGVFHHGRDHFYPDELPKKVLDLRETVLFWINRTKEEFLSCNRARKGLKPQAECVLRFICSERNAGKTISFSELYSYVWRKDPPSFKNMVGSIEVEMSALNVFAAPNPFERTIDPDAKAKIIRCGKAYKIKKETPNACCIVRPFSLPD